MPKINWKPLPLDGELLAKGFSEEFLGIEELTDYTLSKKNRRTGEIVITQKKRKTNNEKAKTEKQPAAKKAKTAEKISTQKVEEISPKSPAVKNTKTTATCKVGKTSPKVSMKSNWKTEDVPTETALPEKKTETKISKNNPEVNNIDTEQKSEAVKNEIQETNEEEEDAKLLSGDNPEGDLDIPDDMTIWQAMYAPQPIIRAIWELGFKSPTPIQLATLPAAMKGRKDVIGAAETGSGKTLAFGIPILHGIMKDKEWEKNKQEKEEEEEGDDEAVEEEEQQQEEIENNEAEEEDEEDLDDEDVEEEEEEETNQTGCVRVIEDVVIPDHFKQPVQKRASLEGKKLRALIITPTRELAVQIEKHLRAISKYTNVTMALVIGGMAAPKQERLLNKGPDIVIGTPGRLWELVQNGHPHLSNLSSIRYLALDETDRLVEQGHFAELRLILEAVNKDANRTRWRQNFIFSATLTLAHDVPERISKKQGKKKKDQLATKLENLLTMVQVRPKPKVVDLTEKAKNLKPATLSEYKIFCSCVEDKDAYLFYFLKHNPGRTLVFCNSINNVRRITSVFSLLQVKPLPLHAQMHQKQRLKHLERFSAEENSLLIATDVAARGLDIPNVQHVVHFQVPRTSENYVHRSGRTARASKSGVSVMFVEPSEEQSYQQLCKTLNKQKQDILDYPIDMVILRLVKERVSLAKRIETLEHRMKRSRVDENWMKKMADEADILVNDDDDMDDEDNEAAVEKDALKKELRLKRLELKSLLAKPLRHRH